MLCQYPPRRLRDFLPPAVNLGYKLTLYPEPAATLPSVTLSSEPWINRNLAAQFDPAGALPPAERAATDAARLDRFLAATERQALRRAEFATRHREEALDLVQDAMLQLARRYAQRPEAEWPLLFSRILTNGIRDWHRRRKLRQTLFFWQSATDESAPDILDTVADPAGVDACDALERDQLLQRLQAALWQLPGRQREAFELRIWEGLDVDTTAQAMGCSQGSVKTHLSRALHRLRDELKEVSL